MNVGVDGRFAEYAGNVIRPGQKVVLLGEAAHGTEARVPSPAPAPCRCHRCSTTSTSSIPVADLIGGYGAWAALTPCD